MAYREQLIRELLESVAKMSQEEMSKEDMEDLIDFLHNIYTLQRQEEFLVLGQRTRTEEYDV